MNKNNLLTVREFTEDEIAEISKYIQNNIPLTILQTIFPLTEDPIKKAEIFTICYRLTNTARNLVKNKETIIKLDKILKTSKSAYNTLFDLLLNEKDALPVFKHKIHNKIRLVIKNKNYNNQINNLIDIFLILGEKFELIDFEKTSGLDLETEEGRQAEKDLLEGL